MEIQFQVFDEKDGINNMLFVFLALTIIGIFILITDFRRESSRWVSAIAFSGAAGGLSVVVNTDIRFLFQLELFYIHRIIDYCRIGLSLLSNYGLPYTYLIFSIVNHKKSPSLHIKRWVKLLLLIPILITLIIFPIYPIQTQFSVFWVVPYIIIASYLLLDSLMNEKNSIIKRDRFNSCLAIIPAMLCFMVNNFILDSIGIKEMYRYNSLAILFSVIVFVISILKHGFVGLRISIQTQKLDYTVTAHFQ